MISPKKKRIFEFRALFPGPWNALVGQSQSIEGTANSVLVGFPASGSLPFEDETIRQQTRQIVAASESIFHSVKLQGDGLLTLLFCLQDNLDVLRSPSGTRVAVDLEEFQYFFGLEARKLKQKTGSNSSEYLSILAAIHHHLGLSEEDWRDL